MKTLIALLLFMASPLLATGPLNKSPSVPDQLEHENIYKELRSPKISTGTAQNFYIAKGSGTLFNIASGTVNSFMVVGTATNDNAPTGRLGEYLSSSDLVGKNFPTSAQYGDFVQISLTPGDWDVSAVLDVAYISGAVTQVRMGISTTSGNSSTGLNEGDNFVLGLGPTATNNFTFSIPSYRISLAATTIHYFKYYAVYTVGAPLGVGRISARRVR